MIPTDPLLMPGHEAPPEEIAPITSGARIPKEGKTLAMIAEQDRRDAALRKKLLRQIHNAECEATGLLAWDFGGDDSDTL